MLAQPAFGVTGQAESGLLRTTGAYRRADDPDRLDAVDPTAAVAAVELVTSEAGPLASLRSGDADWAVLPPGAPSDGLEADIIRLPLDLELALVARHHDVAHRLGVLGALEPLLLAASVDGLTARTTDPATSEGSLPGATLVDAPAGPLAALASEVAEQLVNGGVESIAVPTDAATFSARVAAGDAQLFPVVVRRGAVGLLAYATPGGVDDVFGQASVARTELADAIAAERDASQRAVFAGALERTLVEDGLLLPIGRFEVRVAVGTRLDGLRQKVDGTLDLTRVVVAG